MTYTFLKSVLIAASLCAAPSLSAAEHCCHRSLNIAVSADKGVSVHRPAPLVDRAAIRKIAAAQAKAQARSDQKRRAANQRAALHARLSRIEAQNAQILASQDRSYAPRRRRNVYSGNPPFFGPNGFIGNSNFLGATTLAPRRNKRRPARLKPAAY